MAQPVCWVISRCGADRDDEIVRHFERWDDGLNTPCPRRRRLLSAAIAGLSFHLFWGCNASDVAASRLLGQRLPTRDFAALDGKRQVLGPALGPCLINFWATWCPPCRQEMASLNRFYKAFQSRGLGLFSISVDEDINLLREFLLAVPLAFPVLLDAGGLNARRYYQVSGFPTTLLVGRSGQITDVWVGERNWDDAAIHQACTSLLDL